jgi:pantetheine-phosphate adenylyltransferase
MKAIFAGSFDPFTIEHERIVRTFSPLFEKLYVVVAINPDKTSGMFGIPERKSIIKKSVPDLDNVAVMFTEMLVVDLAKTLGVSMFVRGLRHTTEYEEELRLATGNLLVGDIPTIGLFPRTISISSSDVRLLLRHGNPKWKEYVCVPNYIEKLYRGEERL